MGGAVVYMGVGKLIDLTHLIFRILGRRVMLGADLARLYGVLPKALIQAVKRNRSRFPSDFMFQLSRVEYTNLKSRLVTSSWGGPRRALPYAFTEEGVAMLSSVLRSESAVQANIAVMRAFVRIRALGSQQRQILDKLNQLEGRVDAHDMEIASLIDAIRDDVAPRDRRRHRIGFRSDVARKAGARKQLGRPGR